ncbi:MAG: Rpn family recombination-promoting nuclease/putative transposase [Lachnospiraceae bacterium]|nr:Rpn family recombination-promoting nuclease/putative transposase [Lachnospiraceae bacterium]
MLHFKHVFRQKFPTVVSLSIFSRLLQKGANLTKEKEYVAASNLSDFALFLTVMKNPKAYRNTLSIILDEPDIRLKEVKVEQVILNKSGKRAIRLDAWALSTDDRQFDMEMQNDKDQDSLPKRSRFYQGLMDSPVLKSGKKTKYRNLPSSTIIFITQDDIFKRDLARYTFTEQCEEVADLKLEDGTTKIFLNMTSKNGSKELISLLQYIKNTDINNPEILMKDARLLELDQIVTEVRESEEWEAVRMDLIDIGINKGMELGQIKAIIETCQDLNVSKEDTKVRIITKLNLSEEKADAYITQYWQNL